MDEGCMLCLIIKEKSAGVKSMNDFQAFDAAHTVARTAFHLVSTVRLLHKFQGYLTEKARSTETVMLCSLVSSLMWLTLYALYEAGRC
mmetsp:Transcript_157485/g.277832  ORF Transcript_157485/g.277832 Transcript_157485/m.277832 type:complete len:88 (-) Transcript_157485:33-296(-)